MNKETTDAVRSCTQQQLSREHASLLEETRDVARRLNELNSYMGSPAFPALPREDKDLFYSQQRAMSRYVQILGKRLERVNILFTHAEEEERPTPIEEGYNWDNTYLPPVFKNWDDMVNKARDMGFELLRPKDRFLAFERVGNVKSALPPPTETTRGERVYKMDGGSLQMCEFRSSSGGVAGLTFRPLFISTYRPFSVKEKGDPAP